MLRMERPRLRPLDAYPIEHQGEKLLVLRDPSGVAPREVPLRPMALAILQLCDGESTRDEICAEFSRRYRSPLGRDQLDALLTMLDEALLLDSDRFRQHSAQLFAEFARSPTRPAYLAGKSYPAAADELGALLDSFFEPPRGPGRPAGNGDAASGKLPHALIAPHIDFNRGGPAYAWAYGPLAIAGELPELVVVFGTDHNGADAPFTLTRKHYETPFGAMSTDGELIDALTKAVRERQGEKAAAELFYDEHHHRGEHSIEFQMVWLRYLWRERADAVKVLPILCGSLHALIEGQKEPAHDLRIGVFLDALKELTAGKRVLWIAGADLAHVGPRFGDREPLDQDDRGSLERRDQATLQAVSRGDAKAWFGEIAREQDRRRVCGLPPIHHLLAVAEPRAGQVLAYGQCPADEAGGSLVSIASVVFPGA
jgi:AmmeMemoRadiSam system protein B